MALMLFTPQAALAAPVGACGIPDTSQNPNVVSCISDPTSYQNGIIYDQNTFATPAGLKIDIYGTAVVNTNLAGAAVSVTGSSGNAAQIALRAGAHVTNTGIAAEALASGTGTASIDNHGILAAQTGGLLALGDTSGAAGSGSVINRSDGSVTLIPSSGTVYGALAQGGSASVVNNGAISLTNITGTGAFSGLAAGSYASGGTLSINNTGIVSLDVRGTVALTGMNVIANAGAAALTNSGSVSVHSGSGAATGMLVNNAGVGGATTLTNTGSLAVASDTGTAIGMDVQHGTSVTLNNTQTVTGGTSLTVTGADVIGFRVANATGAVALNNSGVAIGLTAGAGHSATAATLSGGTTQTVQFTDAKPGSTLYSGDVTVQAGGNATGIALSGATGAVNVSLTGASLSVTSTAGNASGVSVSGGSSVQITTAFDAPNEVAANIAVTGGGNGGTAAGIAISGATGTETVNLGQSFSVTNTANGGGAATGITLDGGTDGAITLARGLTVTGAGATGVVAGATTAQSGNDTLTSNAAFTVDGTTGSATGISLNAGGGASATVSRLSVTGTGATGAALTGGTGAVSFTDNGALSVLGGTGAASGISTTGGTDQTIALLQGGTVTGASATGATMSGASGAENFTASDVFTVTGGTGSATGVSASGGTAQTLTFAKALSVGSTGGVANGVLTSGSNAALTLNANDTFTVTSGTAGANGVTVSSSASASTTYAKGLNVHGGGVSNGQNLFSTGAMTTVANGAWSVIADSGQAIGGQDFGGTSQSITLNGAVTIQGVTFAGGFATSGGSGAASIAFNGGLSVLASGGSAAGAAQTGGTTETLSVLSGATISGTASGTYGFRQFGGTDATTFTGTGAIAVSTTSGSAWGIIQSGGSSETITLNDALSVNGAGGSTIGLQQTGSATGLITTKAGFTVANTGTGAIGVLTANSTSSTANINAGMSVTGGSGTSYGVQMTGAGSQSVNVTGDLSVTADNAIANNNAWGILLTGGTAKSAGVTGALTVSANGQAVGASLNGGSGAAGFTAGGPVNVTSVAGSAYGLSLINGTTHTISTAKTVTVSGANAEVYGLRSSQAGGSVAITAADTVTVSNSSGVATGIQVLNGADVTVSVAKAVTATATGTGNAYGLDLSGATDMTTVNVPAGILIKAVANTGAAYGISAVNGAGLTIDPPDVTVTSAGDVYGVYSSGQTGAQNVTLGTVSATSTGATANGVSLSGNGAITLIDAAGITANSATGGNGVNLTQTGTSGAISATLNTVATTGPATIGVNLAQSNAAGTTGAIAATIQSVSTTGAGSTGIAITGSESGAAALTLGSASHTGGVTTTGAGAHGVVLATTNGAGTITNNATIAVSGSGSEGIVATGAGPITIANWNLTTAAGKGIDVTGAGGAVAITSTTVSAAGGDAISAVNTGAGIIGINATTTGATGGRGIYASSGTGAITIAAKTTTATGANAIAVSSTGGNVTVNLADGGATSSSTGAGLSISTGGTATINLGSAATSATITGATAGISSTAAGGQSVTLSGIVGAGNNAAVLLSGGAVTLVNKGTINGYMTLSSAGNTVSNSGTWNAFGGDTTFGGTSTLNNSGTININPAAVAASTARFLNLTSITNSGTISLANGHTGDVLDVGGAAVTGASGKLVLDANLGVAAVGVSAAQSADMLRTTGASGGTTTIVINDLGAAQAGQFNFNGIRVVTNGASSSGAYVLQGGPINKGFVQYVLAQDSGSNWNLVGLPSTAAFELVRTASQAQKFWRRSGDTWAEQVRATDLSRGNSMWMQVYGGGQTDKSAPVYNLTVLGKSVGFNPNLDIRNTWQGVQIGYQLGRENWGVGLTGGYGEQTGRLNATSDQIKIKGGNVGAYLRLLSQEGLYANVLVKVDRFSVNYNFNGLASAPSFNGTTYGANVEVGAHLRSGTMFFEPSAGISATHTDLDGFSGGAGGMAVQFTNNGSAYGRVGLRAGVETKSANWVVRPYVGVGWEGELSGQGHALLSSGGTGVDFADASEGGRARIEAGIQGARTSGLSIFAKVDVVEGSKAHGVAGRAGIALRW